jgi:hypothetical protein
VYRIFITPSTCRRTPASGALEPCFAGVRQAACARAAIRRALVVRARGGSPRPLRPTS